MNRFWMMLGLMVAIFVGLQAGAQDEKKAAEGPKDEKKAEAPKTPAGPFMRSYHNALPFASDLKLTKEQKDKISKVRKDYAEKIAKLMAEERGKLEAVLTDEQKTNNQKLEGEYLKKISDAQASRAKDEADAAKAEVDGTKSTIK